MKKWMGFVLVAGLLATAGCVDTTTMVSLNRDGSGQIVETTYLSAAAMGMMSGMQGEGGAGTKPSNPMLDETKAKAKVSELGEGVSFVSAEEVSKPDGAKGARIVYAFKDINKIKVCMGDSSSSGGGMGSDAGDGEKKKTPVTFAYADGKLTINMPEGSGKAQAVTEEKPEIDPAQQAMGESMMQGMLPMMKGMRMRFMVKVPEAIKETDASHVSVDEKTQKKQVVTLMDFKLDSLLEKENGMKTFMSLQQEKDEAKSMKALAAAGVTVEPRQKVDIRF